MNRRVIATAATVSALIGGAVLVLENGYASVRTECAILEWLCGTAVGVFFCSLAHEVRLDAVVHAKAHEGAEAEADEDALRQAPAINERTRLT